LCLVFLYRLLGAATVRQLDGTCRAIREARSPGCRSAWCTNVFEKLSVAAACCSQVPWVAYKHISKYGMYSSLISAAIYD